MQHVANMSGTIIMKCEGFEPDLSRGKKAFLEINVSLWKARMRVRRQLRNRQCSDLETLKGTVVKVRYFSPQSK